ncbi:AMP-binding protein [Streptomyces sp. NPDC018026]|uniref:AMP-binding protein n=1 Tax=Streptomyces sp. NPDC018026 TaxID=3365031 RepID=UPI0037A1A5BE
MNDRHLIDVGGGTIGGLLARRAAANPDKIAFITPQAEMTYGALDDAATRIASALAGLGLAKGDSVAIFMRNRIEWVTTWMGTARGGFVCVPVNTAYKAAFLQHALKLTKARVVVTEPLLLPALVAELAELPNLEWIVLVEDAPQAPAGVKTLTYQDLLGRAEQFSTSETEIAPADISSIALTSGTTGKSKGVVMPHYLTVVAARENAESMGTTSRDRLYTCLPMFHGSAQFNMCLHGIYAGATIVLAERFSASRFWDEMRAYEITMFNALGPILSILLAQPLSERDRDHQVRRVFAAPAPPDVLMPFEDRFHVHVVEGYGLTEIKNVTYNPIETRKIGSIGKPTTTTELQIHGPTGERLGVGEVGEIVYRPRVANVMFTHYVDDLKATIATMRDMWWRTGDLGYVDADGFYYFVDRQKDALRRRGENISSYEVEVVLMSFAGVVEAAAVGTPSDLGEDEVLAVIETHDGENFDYEALFRHCDQRLPHFMVPRYYRVLPSLPRTPTGKIQKAVLRTDGLADGTWDSWSAGHRPTRPA